MRLLLNRYHPISEDLALTFVKLGFKIDLSVDMSINDHYGSWIQVYKNLKKKYNEFDVISVQQAFLKLKNKQYDLVGVDGVFKNDKEIIELCKQNSIPWFCIQGYPYVQDEPSDNILSFSWFLPQIQYIKIYPSEGHVKEIDWKNIAYYGSSSQKNILIFYPEMNYVKEFWKENISEDHGYFLSLIHRYKECNKWCYDVFKKIEPYFSIENHSGLSQEQSLNKINKSSGLLHLKAFDCPGISVLETLILKKPVYVMKSFINASFNQEVLIDNFNAVIADDVDELIKRMKEPFNTTQQSFDYIYALTSFDRQKNKLERFFNKCLS